jgi:hypothetical protein
MCGRVDVFSLSEDEWNRYGHSLGGFIAEGVRSFHPSARALVMSPGTPRLGNGEVNSWAEYDKDKEMDTLLRASKGLSGSARVLRFRT